MCRAETPAHAHTQTGVSTGSTPRRRPAGRSVLSSLSRCRPQSAVWESVSECVRVVWASARQIGLWHCRIGNPYTGGGLGGGQGLGSHARSWDFLEGLGQAEKSGVCPSPYNHFRWGGGKSMHLGKSNMVRFPLASCNLFECPRAELFVGGGGRREGSPLHQCQWLSPL